MNIYDIAKQAGVSIATVSRVLNHSDSVKPATRDKVLSVIDRANYRPNAFARALSTDSIKLCGVLCTDVSDAFFAQAVSILQQLLRQEGFTVLLGCTGDEAQEKKRQLDFMLEKHVDFIILIGSAFSGDDCRDFLFETAQNTPLILINAKLRHENIYSVYCDDKSAVFSVVSSLINLGSKRILYLYDALTPSAQAKLAGYKSGLASAGIPFDNRLIRKTEKSIAGGMESVAAAYADGLIPDAVITAEDILAVGALKEIQKRHGMQSVVGYNNSSLCECSSPTLSSVDNRLCDMCRKATEIIKKVSAGEKPDNKYKFSAKLVLRESFKGEKEYGTH